MDQKSAFILVIQSQNDDEAFILYKKLILIMQTVIPMCSLSEIKMRQFTDRLSILIAQE